MCRVRQRRELTAAARDQRICQHHLRRSGGACSKDHDGRGWRPLYIYPNQSCQRTLGITTTTVGVAAPVAPAAITVSTVGTAVTLTETAAAGYVFTSASCTDANSAVTGNVGAIGTVAGTTLTIPAANVKSSADFTCVFNNIRRPSVTLTKISNGGVGRLHLQRRQWLGEPDDYHGDRGRWGYWSHANPGRRFNGHNDYRDDSGRLCSDVGHLHRHGCGARRRPILPPGP